MKYIPSFLKDVAADGKLGLAWFPMLGSLLDFSGNENAVSSVAGYWPNNGFQPSGMGAVFAADTPLEYTGEITTISYYAAPLSGDGISISKRNASSTDYQLMYDTVNGVRLYHGGYVAAAVDYVGKKCIATTNKAGTAGKCYLDGQYAADFSGISYFQTTGVPVYLGSYYLGAASVIEKTPSYAKIIIMAELTATEILDIYNGLEALYAATRGPSSFVNNAMIKPPHNLDGCSLALDGSMVGTAVGNKGTGDNGVNSGLQPVKKHVLGGGFKGFGSEYATHATVGSVKLVSCWAYLESTTEDLFDLDGGTHTIEATVGTLTATGFSSPSIFVNGSASTTITANSWNHLLFYTETAFTAASLKHTMCDGILLDIYCLANLPVDPSGNTITPANWAKMEYQKGLRALKQYCATGMRETVSALAAGAWIMPREIQLVTGTATVTGVFVNENHFFKINFTSASTVKFAEHLGVGGHLYGWTDTGSGMEWGEITMTSRVASFVSGSALYISRQPGYAIYDRLLEEL